MISPAEPLLVTIYELFLNTRFDTIAQECELPVSTLEALEIKLSCDISFSKEFFDTHLKKIEKWALNKIKKSEKEKSQAHHAEEYDNATAKAIDALTVYVALEKISPLKRSWTCFCHNLKNIKTTCGKVAQKMELCRVCIICFIVCVKENRIESSRRDQGSLEADTKSCPNSSLCNQRISEVETDALYGRSFSINRSV